MDFIQGFNRNQLQMMSISDNDSLTVTIKYTSDKLYLNKKELKGFSKFNGFSKISSVDIIPAAIGITCCRACYIVHDILDIHELDCICCLASCGYSCGRFFSIGFSL